MNLRTLFPLLFLGAWLVAHAVDPSQPEAKAGADAPPKALRVLLVAGGCCHDYAAQKDVLKAGIESRIAAEVDIAYNPDKSTKAVFPVYESEDWAKGYDVILHDECSADVKDPAYVKRILDAHAGGVPAVNLHCAMHSYRWGNYREPVEVGADNAGWFEMLGLQSTGHGPKEPVEVTFTDKAHPITIGLEDWTTGNEELYNNVKMFDSAHALASGKQWVKPRRRRGQPEDAEVKPKLEEAVVIWTNQYGPEKTKIFSTTLGHYTETVADDRYLDLVTRGLLWVTGHLGDDGKATGGYGTP